MDELFEMLTLIQTLKVEAFPVVLYGSKYWAGLVKWLRDCLRPHYVDPEDIDIFKLADSPKEAVQIVRQGMKKPWWRPLDAELQERLEKPEHAQPPIAGAKAETGEGTRYGKRPKSTQKRHAKPPRKPDEPERVTVKHILVKYKESKSAPPSIMRTREAACLRAVEARDALKEGKSFADAVLVYSDEPGGKTREGSLGSIQRTDVLPAFADVAFALAKGESSQVVETEYGFHIIMRTE